MKIRGTYKDRIYTKVKPCKVCNTSFLVSKHNKTWCSNDCKKVSLNEYQRKYYHQNLEKVRALNKTKRLRKKEVYQAIQIRYNRKKGMTTREEWYERQPKGPEHHWWNGGSSTEMSERLNDKNWHKLRVEIWKRDSFKCQHCFRQVGRGLKPITHHIVPWRETQDDSRGNLITLCNSCHLKEHHRLRQVAKVQV